MVKKEIIQQTLVNLITVRRLPFSCVKWPEFHAFIKALNLEADSLDYIPTTHLTILT